MNIYDKITNEIISKIESEKILPWQKPWNVIPARNLVTGRPYQGFNSLYLNTQPFKSPFWMTFLQCRKLGGRIKSGEKARMVIFWEKNSYQDSESGKIETSILSKVYFLFNLVQTEGVPEDKIPKIQYEHIRTLSSSSDLVGVIPEGGKNPIEEAEAIIRNYKDKPEIRFHNQDRAYYSPAQDIICIPAKESFKNQEEFFATLFHESVHSSGHESRLNRQGITKKNKFGSEDYSKEELIAELGAAFLCAESGIVNKTINNSASYLQNWLEILKSDPRMIIFASQAAEKAARYILNRKEV